MKTKALHLEVELGHSSPLMGFEPPIEEPQHEVALASTPLWGTEEREKRDSERLQISPKMRESVTVTMPFGKGP